MDKVAEAKLKQQMVKEVRKIAEEKGIKLPRADSGDAIHQPPGLK